MDNDIRGKVREMLRSLFNEGIKSMFRDNVDCNKKIDDTLTQILEAVCGEVEKLRIDSHYRSNEGFNRDYRVGYNQALTDIQSLLRGTK